MTPSVHFADVKGNRFPRNIYPLSLIVIALTVLKFSEEGEGEGGGAESAPTPPGSGTKKSPSYIELRWLTTV